MVTCTTRPHSPKWVGAHFVVLLHFLEGVTGFTLGVELGLVDHTPCLFLAVGHAAVTTPERIEEELVLTSVHCNGDFMQIAVKQPGVLPGSLSIFPFEQDDMLAVLPEPRVPCLVMHAGIIWVEMVVSQHAAHCPSILFGLLEVFINETHDLVAGDVFIELFIVALDSESHEFIGAVLRVVKVSSDSAFSKNLSPQQIPMSIESEDPIIASKE